MIAVYKLEFDGEYSLVFEQMRVNTTLCLFLGTMTR